MAYERISNAKRNSFAPLENFRFNFHPSKFRKNKKSPDSPKLYISISHEFMKKLKWKDSDRIGLFVGTGDDAGYVKLIPHENGNKIMIPNNHDGDKYKGARQTSFTFGKDMLPNNIRIRPNSGQHTSLPDHQVFARELTVLMPTEWWEIIDEEQ